MYEILMIIIKTMVMMRMIILISAPLQPRKAPIHNKGTQTVGPARSVESAESAEKSMVTIPSMVTITVD
jgi:hypothetical protein